MLRRTALTTAGALAAVVVTGTLALGANLGLFTTESASAAGAAVEEVAQPETIDLFLSPTTEPSPEPTAGPVSTEQEFTVDRAGTLVVAFTSTDLAVADVSPADGWNSQVVESTATSVLVSFTNGDSVIEFVAELNLDGSLSATVDELITEYVRDPSVTVEVAVPAPAPQPTATATPSDPSTASTAAALLASPPNAVASSGSSDSTSAVPTAAAPTAPAAVPTASPTATFVDDREGEDDDRYDDDRYEDDDHEDDEDDDRYEDDDHEDDDEEDDDVDEDDDHDDHEDDDHEDDDDD